MLGWEIKPLHISSLSNWQKILKIRNDFRIQIKSRVAVRLCEDYRKI